jgi:alpha-glucosidase
VQYYGAQLDGLHLPFNFELMHLPWSAPVFRDSVDALEAALPPGAWPNYVLGSHDRPRLATRYGERAVRIAAMLLFTLRGTPTIYMGEEIGMQDGAVPLERMQDPQGLNISPDRSRDPCRTPLQWSSAPYAGFSTVEPWLPVANDYLSRNVKSQKSDEHSLLTLYQRLLHIRKHSPALAHGRYSPLDNAPPDCYLYLRENEQERFLIALNFGTEPRELDLNHSDAYLVISTELDRAEGQSSSPLTLRSHEGIIFKLPNGA